MPDQRPRIVVVQRHEGHGCLITILLMLLAWPLAIVYWILRVVAWIVGVAVDWLTLGPARRRRRR